jgi:hypothetical protein
MDIVKGLAWPGRWLGWLVSVGVEDDRRARCRLLDEFWTAQRLVMVSVPSFELSRGEKVEKSLFGSSTV